LDVPIKSTEEFIQFLEKVQALNLTEDGKTVYPVGFAGADNWSSLAEFGADLCGYKTHYYTGTWNYDSANNRFIYVGLCESKVTNIKYYDLEELIKLEYENDDINAYYYVGFAKVVDNNYTIYKDANMTVELTKGTFTTLDNLNKIFEGLDKKNKNIYKYTFKNTLCTYNEYCLYQGEWINEL